MITSNQISELRQKLQLAGIKDSQFKDAKPLDGSEDIALVQQGANVKMPLKEFIEETVSWNLSDFINLSKSDNEKYSLEEAIKLVETINRKPGQVITFIDKDANDWAIYQFKGNSNEWFNLDKWDNILAKVDCHFQGWYLNECILKEHHPRPHVGDFAFVGESFADSVIYGCIKYGNWYDTKEAALQGKVEASVYILDLSKMNNIDSYNELKSAIHKNKLIYIKDKGIVISSDINHRDYDGLNWQYECEEITLYTSAYLDGSTSSNSVQECYVNIRRSLQQESWISLDDIEVIQGYTSTPVFIKEGRDDRFLNGKGEYSSPVKYFSSDLKNDQVRVLYEALKSDSTVFIDNKMVLSYSLYPKTGYPEMITIITMDYEEDTQPSDEDLWLPGIITLRVITYKGKVNSGNIWED